MNEEIQQLKEEILKMKSRLRELRRAAIAEEIADYELMDGSGARV